MDTHAVPEAHRRSGSRVRAVEGGVIAELGVAVSEERTVGLFGIPILLELADFEDGAAKRN